MKILEVVDRVKVLTNNAPYAVIGGLAQILWARKTHTDDLDMALAAGDLVNAWRLPRPPDPAHEENEVFRVYHLLYRGSVVDLISFGDQGFTQEILETARPVLELGGMRFIRPELLLMTHLLRPGAPAALAAIELVLARRGFNDLDLPYAERWAARLGRGEALRRAVARADDLSSTSDP
jgi:hypothetical protein